MGGINQVTLAEARERARERRKVAKAGDDPSLHRDRQELTFKAAAEGFFTELQPTWRNQKHAETWIGSLRLYAFLRIGNHAPETIGPADVMAVLSPIWVVKHETARRVEQRFGTIFDWAKGAGHYQSENPVNGQRSPCQG